MILIFFKKIKSNHFCLAEKKVYDIFLKILMNEEIWGNHI
jgi:hypothetical protein